MSSKDSLKKQPNEMEVEEVIDIGQDEDFVMEEPDDLDDMEEQFAIDISNNSYSYFDKHRDSIFLVAAHPKLNLILSGACDNSAYLWKAPLSNNNNDVENKNNNNNNSNANSRENRIENSEAESVISLSGQNESVVAGGFTSDGMYAVTGDMTGQIRVWAAQRNKNSEIIWDFYDSVELEDEIVWISFHPSRKFSRFFAVGLVSGSVIVYTFKGKSLLQVSYLTGHTLATSCGEFIPVQDSDSNSSSSSEEITLITASEDTTLIAWSIPAGTQIWKTTCKDFNIEDVSSWVTLSLDCTSESNSRNIGAVGARNGSIGIFNVFTGKVLKTLNTNTFIPFGSAPIPLDECSIEGIAWGSGASLDLLVVGNVHGDIFIIDSKGWRLRKLIRSDKKYKKVEENSKSELQESDKKENNEEDEDETQFYAITKISLIPNEPYIIVSSMDKTLRKIDLRTGETVWTGTGHNEGILNFAFFNENKRVVTAGDDGVSLLYDITG